MAESGRLGVIGSVWPRMTSQHREHAWASSRRGCAQERLGSHPTPRVVPRTHSRLRGGDMPPICWPWRPTSARWDSGRANCLASRESGCVCGPTCSSCWQHRGPGPCPVWKWIVHPRVPAQGLHAPSHECYRLDTSARWGCQLSFGEGQPHSAPWPPMREFAGHVSPPGECKQASGAPRFYGWHGPPFYS